MRGLPVTPLALALLSATIVPAVAALPEETLLRGSFGLEGAVTLSEYPCGSDLPGLPCEATLDAAWRGALAGMTGDGSLYEVSWTALSGRASGSFAYGTWACHVTVPLMNVFVGDVTAFASGADVLGTWTSPREAPRAVESLHAGFHVVGVAIAQSFAFDVADMTLTFGFADGAQEVVAMGDLADAVGVLALPPTCAGSGSATAGVAAEVVVDS